MHGRVLINVATDAKGADSVQRWHLTSIGNPIVEIRRSHDRLISTMGFPILVRWHLYIELAIRIYSTSYICIILDQFHRKILQLWDILSENRITFWKHCVWVTTQNFNHQTWNTVENPRSLRCSDSRKSDSPENERNNPFRAVNWV